MKEKERIWSVDETQIGRGSDQTSADGGVSGTQYKHIIHTHARTNGCTHTHNVMLRLHTLLYHHDD